MTPTPYSIRLATTPAERLAIFRLRYVLSAEPPPWDTEPDQAPGVIVDSLDDFALLLGAWHGGRCLATIRTNLVRAGDIGGYRHLSGLDRVAQREACRSSLTSRFAIFPGLRDSSLAIALASAVIDLADDLHVTDDYLVCHRELASVFIRLGYRPVRSPGANDTVLRMRIGKARGSSKLSGRQGHSHPRWLSHPSSPPIPA
jgi:hypothetical protein